MLYVNIKITEQGVTPSQKAALIKGVKELLPKVLGKKRQLPVVTIDEVKRENWGMGGEPVLQYRAPDRGLKGNDALR